ncbi:hypothetical protein MTR67_050664 [Solanum verrucosum]|uniref:K-box domain-containing protein n=1 Tax=Solanum verrucosum TaxID=315347 RepID=A0AAF0V4V0_SOLVR|nr:hypothetical protein MTR67_050664 [Solanum verrucosum]
MVKNHPLVCWQAATVTNIVIPKWSNALVSNVATNIAINILQPMRSQPNGSTNYYVAIVSFFIFFFSFYSTNKTIERYQKNDKNLRHDKILLEQTTEHLKEEVMSMTRNLEVLENSKRRLLGEDLESCSIDELEKVEGQLDQSLRNIRAKKNQLYKEKISLLKDEEKVLMEKNAELREKYEALPLPLFIDRQEDESPQARKMEVDTQLFIGFPER